MSRTIFGEEGVSRPRFWGWVAQQLAYSFGAPDKIYGPRSTQKGMAGASNARVHYDKTRPCISISQIPNAPASLEFQKKNPGHLAGVEADPLVIPVHRALEAGWEVFRGVA